MKDVTGIFVDETRVIEGGMATVRHWSSGQSHEEEPLLALPSLGKDFGKEGTEQGRARRTV